MKSYSWVTCVSPPSLQSQDVPSNCKLPSPQRKARLSIHSTRHWKKTLGAFMLRVDFFSTSDTQLKCKAPGAHKDCKKLTDNRKQFTARKRVLSDRGLSLYNEFRQGTLWNLTGFWNFWLHVHILYVHSPISIWSTAHATLSVHTDLHLPK